MPKVVFMSRIKRYQTFGPKGRAIKFIGGRFETEDAETISFLREQIAKKSLLYSGREVVFEKIPPAPPVKCIGCSATIPAGQKFCGYCGQAVPVGNLAKPVVEEKPAEVPPVSAPVEPEKPAEDDKPKRSRSKPAEDR